MTWWVLFLRVTLLCYSTLLYSEHRLDAVADYKRSIRIGACCEWIRATQQHLIVQVSEVTDDPHNITGCRLTSAAMWTHDEHAVCLHSGSKPRYVLSPTKMLIRELSIWNCIVDCVDLLLKLGLYDLVGVMGVAGRRCYYVIVLRLSVWSHGVLIHHTI